MLTFATSSLENCFSSLVAIASGMWGNVGKMGEQKRGDSLSRARLSRNAFM